LHETATVNIHVHELSQLFNGFDPSPLADRDLDRGAAEFIESEFRDKIHAAAWHLRVHVSAGPLSAGELREAISNHYGREAMSAQAALADHLWMARLQLAGGIAIFALATSARGMIRWYIHTVPSAINDALIILGGLALWRPMEALLYEWVPFFRARRLFERLAGMQVSILPSALAAKSSQAATVAADVPRQRLIARLEPAEIGAVSAA
jgi:hypothetical protein